MNVAHGIGPADHTVFTTALAGPGELGDQEVVKDHGAEFGGETEQGGFVVGVLEAGG